ncbi:unnamed protein product [Paramecium primaurelia]|uniref:Uncharacterized protein n=1 Tax=Paramecium primaurelia TaxID=5886 RepID=A0A8S1MFL4_PARPR|nr:unnamed protein product [Paramecium primaurelia]
MGCIAQKVRSQPRDQGRTTYPNSQSQNQLNQQSKILATEPQVGRVNSEINVPHSPQIGRRLKHMVSSDELQKYITKRQSITQSPFKYIKNSPEQRRKLSLMNSPQL